MYVPVGDIYPVTSYGRGVACLAAVLGIIVIALPVTVLGSNFSAEYENYTRRQTEYRALREALKIKQAKLLASASRRATHGSKSSSRRSSNAALSMSASRKLPGDLEWTKSPIVPTDNDVFEVDALGLAESSSSVSIGLSSGPILTKSMHSADVSEMEFISSTNSEQMKILTIAMNSQPFGTSGTVSSQSTPTNCQRNDNNANRNVNASSISSNSLVTTEMLSRVPPDLRSLMSSDTAASSLTREDLLARFEELKNAHLRLLATIEAVKSLTV